MPTSRAFRCHQVDGRVESRLETLPARAAGTLAAGEGTARRGVVGIDHSDALAATGAGKIMRRFLLTAGIDVAGVVEASEDPRFRVGDAAVVVGCGLGEEVDGGFADETVVRGDWIVRPPSPLTLRDAMAVGTAGFTAGLAIDRLEHNGLTPDAGPVAVTGATGGVGSLAIAMLATRGYRVSALTGKTDAGPYLTSLGASEVVDTTTLTLKARPLETARWAAAIDNLGGDMLAWLCATTQPLGGVASVGLAAAPTLQTTVMPFILRGVNLLGINSTYCPADRRDRVWTRIAADVPGGVLDTIVRRTVDLADIATAFDGYTARGITGRTLVRVSGTLHG
ncbi:MAG: acryloyl-CoA reductase [Vicinamibacterales bacterium]